MVHYPLKVAGLGNWFTLGPHIKTVSQSDIPKPHYTAPVVMDHDWDQDVGVFTATELEDWAHLASVPKNMCFNVFPLLTLVNVFLASFPSPEIVNIQ